MALTTVSSDRLSTNVKTSNLGTELKKKVGQDKNLIINGAMLNVVLHLHQVTMQLLIDLNLIHQEQMQHPLRHKSM